MEDDGGAARLFQRKLERLGYTVDIASNGGEGLEMFAANTYDLLAVDQRMPVYDGLEVIRVLAERKELPPTIMITGAGDERVAVEAMKLGAGDYIVKDIDGGYLELLPTVIDQLLQRQRLVEERQQALEALEARNRDLQARNEELDAFSHMVAHDLKNPLSLVIGYAQFLRKRYTQALDQEAVECLEQIEQSGVKMTSIIDELLLLAKIRSAEVQTVPLDMSDIVAMAELRLSHMIQEYQAQITWPEEWPVALGQEAWIEEVWVNYLSNALKYGGRPPCIELGATVREDGMVCFWVRDNGPGLTPEQQARLFTPFTRLNQVRVEGHGLGLSIVRRIVEKLGGEVAVKSVVAQGSTFSFTLPLATAKERQGN
jgi:signal transduction histidine kinase